MKIAIDVDGTILKTMCFVCSLINFKLGTNYTFKDIKNWTYWQDIGLDKEFWETYNFMDCYGRLLIKPYDSYVFSSLSKINSIINNKFTLLTANNESAEPSIYEWMEINCGNPELYLPWFDIKCIGRTTCKEKLGLDFQIYLDDNPNMADEIVNFPDKKMILFNCPWNKNVKETNQVKRVESWKEVPGLIKNIMQTMKPRETLREKAARLGFKEMPSFMFKENIEKVTNK